MKMKPALLIALTFALALPMATPPARAQVAGAPAFVDYQGTAYKSTGEPLGSTGSGTAGSPFLAAPTNYVMQFKIFDAQSGGALIYAETQTVTASLGAFSVRLGAGAQITGLSPAPVTTSIANAFNAKDRYLELTVIIPPAATGTPITPRLAFQSSPFSLVAERAKTADSVVQSSGTSTLGTTTASNFTVAGPAKINANNTLEFGGGIAGKDGSAGKIGYNAFGSNALDIAGAGTSGSNRLLKIWAEGGTTFTGPISGTSASFSGNLSANNGLFAGPISGTSASFSGNLSANNGLFQTLNVNYPGSSQVTSVVKARPGDLYVFDGLDSANRDVFLIGIDGGINILGGGSINISGGGGINISGPNASFNLNALNYPTVTSVIKARPGDIGMLSLFDTNNTETHAFRSNGLATKIGGGSWATFSDSRLKKNIEDLTGSLQKLLKLRSVSYEYKNPDKYGKGQKIGFVAQEIEKVFPSWVTEEPDGFKIVTFYGFEALTVQALRELREEKDEQLKARDSEISDLKKRLADLETKELKGEARLVKLEQALLESAK